MPIDYPLRQLRLVDWPSLIGTQNIVVGNPPTTINLVGGLPRAFRPALREIIRRLPSIVHRLLKRPEESACALFCVCSHEITQGRTRAGI